MPLEQLISDLRRRHTFFNKPRSSFYRVQKYCADSNLFVDYAKLVGHYQACCEGTPEEPKLLVRNGGGVSPVPAFRANHAAYRQQFRNVFVGSQEAWILYSETCPETSRYFINQRQIEDVLMKEFNDIRLPTLNAAVRCNGLERLMANGEIVARTMVGNCGDCCDYVASRLVKEFWDENSRLPRIQWIQVSYSAHFGAKKETVFNHCFLILGGEELMSARLSGLESATVVDPWNLYAMEYPKLRRSTARKTEFMRFIFEELACLDSSLYFYSEACKEPQQVLDAGLRLPSEQKLARLEEIAAAVRGLN